MSFDINLYNMADCEKELRCMFERYNELEENVKENLVLFALIGIGQVNKDKLNEKRNGT